MVLPTLLSPGKIKILPHYTSYEKQQINTISAKDYLMSWFKKRLPSKMGMSTFKIESVGDKIMILQSGTGSGKSVTLGPELYKNFFDITNKNIIVTQPRILTTMGIPEKIASVYPEMIMGKNLGYQTGDYIYKPKKGVLFMTIGVLAQQLKVMTDDEIMNKYSFIIIDECHDRSLDMDLTLSLLKVFKKSSCPFLILTSATFDTVKYANYFNVDTKGIITVEGLNYPIETVFSSVDINNYISTSVHTALKIHNTNTSDYNNNNKVIDILIFVYGGAPLREITQALHTANSKLKNNNFVVIELNRDTFIKGDIMYRNIFKPLSSISVNLGIGGKDVDEGSSNIVTPKRRIIVSTNIAETGVTIDTLKYIIDTGYENSSIFNPVYSASILIPKAETRASVLQRKGRVGRVAPGVWYPMFTEKTFKTLQKDAFPDVISSDITSTLLGIMVKTCYPNYDGILNEAKSSVEFDINSLDLLDAPANESIKYSLEKLFVLGLIDEKMTPTTIGLAITCITKISIESTRMILAGYQWGANILSLITITAFMQIGKRNYIDTRSKMKYTYENIFKKNKHELKFYSKLFISDDFIETIFIWEDLIDQIQIMKKKLSINHIKKWCKENGLLYDGILQIIDIRDGLIGVFIQSLGLDPYYNGLGIESGGYILKKILQTNFSLGIDEITKFKKCIYEGYRLNMATWDESKGAYYFDYNHQKVKISSDIIQPLPNHETIHQSIQKKIIVKEMDLKENRFSHVYEFQASTVSCMDGFVDIDETFVVS
jgi:HrpA-like RNA helicase